MKFVLSIIILLFICPNCLAQELTEPPPTVLRPDPDPIGNLNSDQELNRTTRCCDIWYQRKWAREEWDKGDERLDELVDEIRALYSMMDNVANDPDLTSLVRKEILDRIWENLEMKFSERSNLEEAMDELRIFIHQCNEQWLLERCGFYPTI